MIPYIISQADSVGGAARAAFRLHRALRAAKVNSRMLVRLKASGDWTVEGPTSLLGRAAALVRAPVGERALALERSEAGAFRSANLLPSRWSSRLNSGPADVVNVHWVGGETLSIEDIGRIKKPLVWTCHDMWAFSGTAHYEGDGGDALWRTGYDGRSRPPSRSGLNLDRWVWTRKARSWGRPAQVVCPSRWLAECASGSALMRTWHVSVIPNVVDTDTFKPPDRGFARQMLGWPASRPVILFGAIRPGADKRKGLDLLLAALRELHVRARSLDPLCVVFGESEPEKAPDVPIELRWTGHVHDDHTLVLLYGAADVTVIPSRQENLPQVGTEAAACGCPVVAFDTGGLPDVVENGVTGYLARPYEPEDLAEGIAWVLSDVARVEKLRAASRDRATRLWRPQIVIPQYLATFRRAMNQEPDPTTAPAASPQGFGPR